MRKLGRKNNSWEQNVNNTNFISEKYSIQLQSMWQFYCIAANLSKYWDLIAKVFVVIKAKIEQDSNIPAEPMDVWAVFVCEEMCESAGRCMSKFVYDCWLNDGYEGSHQGDERCI